LLFARRSLISVAASALLFGCLLMQVLASYYLGYAGFVEILVVLAVVTVFDPQARARWWRLVAPLIASVVILAFISGPYVQGSRSGAIAIPSPEFVRMNSAALGGTGENVTVLFCLLTLGIWRKGVRADVPFAWLVGVALVGVAGHLLAL